MSFTEPHNTSPMLCDWCGAPATSTCVRTIKSFDTSTVPATGIQRNKVFHECDHCWKMDTKDLLSRDFRVNISSGKLIAKRCADSDFPGIELWYLPDGASEPIHIVSVEEYTKPLQYGHDAPEKYYAPESRRGSAYCEVDKHNVSCITPGLMCRVYPSIFKDWEESVNTAFDHVDYRQKEENLNESF